MYSTAAPRCERRAKCSGLLASTLFCSRAPSTGMTYDRPRASRDGVLVDARVSSSNASRGGGINGLVLTADRKAHLRLLESRTHGQRSEAAGYCEIRIDARSTFSRPKGRCPRRHSSLIACSRWGVDSFRLPIPCIRPISRIVFGPERSPTLLTVIGNPDLWKTPASRSAAVGNPVPQVWRSRERSGGLSRPLARLSSAGSRRASIARRLKVHSMRAAAFSDRRRGLLQSRWARRRKCGRVGSNPLASLHLTTHGPRGGRWHVTAHIAGFSSALVMRTASHPAAPRTNSSPIAEAGLRVYVARGPGEGALVDESAAVLV